MHTLLGDYLAVEVGELFQVPDILEQYRAARAGRHGVLVVYNGRAVACGQFFFFFHSSLLLLQINELISSGG